MVSYRNSDYATMICSDPNLCYDVVPLSIASAETDEWDPRASADKSVEWLDRDKVDWDFNFDAENEDSKGIPLSWLAVSNINEGEQWYREHTRMPESMINYIARYHWSDGLKTPEGAKEKKKGRKRKEKKDDPANKLQVNRGKFVVDF